MHARLRLLYQIDASPDGPARARKIVASELTQLVPRPVVEDVELMISELVTDGVLRGRQAPDAKITLDLQINGQLRCAVTSSGHGFGADGAMSRMSRRVLERLAARWGVQRTRPGTRVTWFETSAPASHRSETT
jgi:hypothetical protein